VVAWCFVDMACILAAWWCDLFLLAAGQDGLWKQTVLSFNLAGGSIPFCRASLCCVLTYWGVRSRRSYARVGKQGTISVIPEPFAW